MRPFPLTLPLCGTHRPVTTPCAAWSCDGSSGQEDTQHLAPSGRYRRPCLPHTWLPAVSSSPPGAPGTVGGTHPQRDMSYVKIPCRMNDASFLLPTHHRALPSIPPQTGGFQVFDAMFPTHAYCQSFRIGVENYVHGNDFRKSKWKGTVR